ncbi:hypothetical protein J4401_05775 [Candidatus Woesearchaeota archaeon]|nr:hypothetical protein [Candidatus Woesearchaeota archaeon]
MTRGRPVGSNIRQNIIEVLHFMGKGYGYDIYRKYIEIFPPVTMRSIYYHLSKGVKTDEFKIDSVRKEEGDYSWGSLVTKTYYALGPKAKPAIVKEAKEYFSKN